MAGGPVLENGGAQAPPNLEKQFSITIFQFSLKNQFTN